MRPVIVLLAILMLQNPRASRQQQGVVERGDHVMGFRITKPSIISCSTQTVAGLTSPPTTEPTRRALTRSECTWATSPKCSPREIATPPVLIHDTAPPGVPTMQRLKNEIK